MTVELTTPAAATQSNDIVDRLRSTGNQLDAWAADVISRFRKQADESRRPLTKLATEVLAINQANGWSVTHPQNWADTHKVPAVLALIHSEVSEALEAFRADDRANFEEELADVVIRVLDLAGGLQIDLDAAIAAKLAKNKTRGHRHGGKRI